MTYAKKRYNVLKPEDVRLKTEYAISYNPEVQPAVSYRGDVLFAYKKWYNDVFKKFKRLKYSKYKMYVEVSSGSRLHYHGVMYITDIIKFYIYDLPLLKKDSAFEIDDINDKEVWSNYVLKLNHIMEPFCEEKDFPYKYISDDYNLDEEQVQQNKEVDMENEASDLFDQLLQSEN